jgi:sigma-E factor negative regulatory protein RseC
MTMVVGNEIGARPGDQVVLSLSEAAVVKASAVLYLIPTVFLIGGAAIGWSQSLRLGLGADPAAILGSMVGLAVGLIVTKLLGAKMGKSGGYIPRLTAIKTRADGFETNSSSDTDST